MERFLPSHVQIPGYRTSQFTCFFNHRLSYLHLEKEKGNEPSGQENPEEKV